jgi:hypothetical protein
MSEKSNEQLWRCTVCGQIGTVGRCCWRDTREPVGGTAGANEPKHTPGPWRVEDGYYETHLDIVAKCGHRVAVATMTYPMDAARVTANAELIAAAPELLEALRSLVENEDETPSWNQRVAARAVIAKATGKGAGE